MSRTDEEVYQKLVKERNKRQVTVIAVLAFLLFLFVVATIVLSVLYFGDGELVKESEIKVYTDGGYIQDTNIDSYQSATNGDVSIQQNNTTLIGILIVSGLVVFGGFICLLFYLRDRK